MNTVEFKNWLIKNKNMKKKLIADNISRLNRIERELSCDIDEEYHRDKCAYLMSLFLKMGINENMKKYDNINLPIGKYYMSTYRLSLKHYIHFCEDIL